MKWDEMSPRERDALVAEKVMSWTRRTFPGGGGGGVVAWVNADDNITWLEGNASLTGMDRFWRPTTDISAAWEVVEKIRSNGYDLELKFVGYGVSSTGNMAFAVFFRGLESTPICSAETAPEAICLAALRAEGVEV